MKVDYENNILEVPATGADDMTLAFVTDTRIDILLQKVPVAEQV